MANSTNLFYQLYSNDKNSYVSAGYTCSSAINEADTSFDITDSKGVITDSNGDTLASIDFSGVHASPTSEYSVQTKILQPFTSYLLQGNSFGLSYAAHYFKLCKELAEIDNYANYCDVQFDVTYSHNFKTKSLHINTMNYRKELMTEEGEGNTTSVWILLQKILDKICIPITITEVYEKDSDCECCDKTSTYESNTEDENRDYIKFLSNVLGFQFIIRNLRLIPIYQDENYPDSPFAESVVTTQDIIDAIKDVNDEWKEREDVDDDTKKTIQYIDCDVYVYILEHMADGLNALDDPDDDIYKAHGLDSDYIHSIYEKVYELTGLTTLVEPEHKIHKLMENLDKEVPAVKYPNGAFRGLFIVPVYPLDSDDQAQSLMLAPIKDFVEVYHERQIPIEDADNYDSDEDEKEEEETSAAPIDENTEDTHEDNDEEDLWSDSENPDDDSKDDSTASTGYEILYEKDIVAVMAASKVQNEYIEAQASKCPCKCISLNFINNGVVSDNYQDNEWIAASNPYENIEQFRKDIINENDVWVEDPHDSHYRDTHIELASKSMGMYGFLNWSWENDNWVKFGQFYGLITQADDENTNIKNLHPSVFLYNPNNYPVKVNFMMF